MTASTLYRFTNNYRCESCDTEWSDDYSCQVDDECPSCGDDISPESSEEYNVEDTAGADIVIRVKGGMVVGVDAPPGYSVQVRDYDVESADDEDLGRDEDGHECTYEWLVTPDETRAWVDSENKVQANVRAALTEAESFISGFEDDEIQKGISELLVKLREAIKAVTEPVNG